MFFSLESSGVFSVNGWFSYIYFMSFFSFFQMGGFFGGPVASYFGFVVTLVLMCAGVLVLMSICGRLFDVVCRYCSYFVLFFY